MLADNLQSQIIARPLGVDFKNTFKALAQTVAALMGDLDMLVDGWLNLQLQLHEGAIVDKREDTVEIDRLWRIPVDRP